MTMRLDVRDLKIYPATAPEFSVLMGGIGMRGFYIMQARRERVKYNIAINQKVT